MSKFFPPANFSYLSDTLFRSAFPAKVNISFLESLEVDNILILRAIPIVDLQESLTSFTHSLSSLETIEEDLKVPKCGNMHDFTLNNHIHQTKTQANIEEVRLILDIIKQHINERKKILICCAKGTHVSNMIIGVIRKCVHKWSLASCFDEMRRYTGVQLVQEQFVEIFEE